MEIKRLFALTAAVTVLAGCGNHLTEEPVTGYGETGYDDNGSILVGGYTNQREPAEEEIAMFRSVIGTEKVAYTPLSVSTQVVAGINYRFYCRFEGTSDGVRCKSAEEGDKYGYCWVTIFKPLPGRGEPTLSSIEKIQQ